MYPPLPSEKQLQQFHQHSFLFAPNIFLTTLDAISPHVLALTVYFLYQPYQQYHPFVPN